MERTQKKENKNKRRSAFFYYQGGEESKYFAENLSLLLSSGMDIVSALNAVNLEIRSKPMRKIIEYIREDIDAGYSVSAALEKSGLLPDYAISLLKIGERTGKLADNLKIVAVEQQKERNFKSKVTSAMMYPALVFSITIVVGIGIAWFILPRLVTVFSQLKIELPLITRILLGLGDFLGRYGYVAVPSFIFLFLFFIYFAFFFTKTKFIGQALLFSIPGTKKMIREIELARTGYLLGTLLQAGIPIVEAIKSLTETSSFPAYRKFHAYIGEEVADGNSFQQIFSSYPKSGKLIPISISHMIVAGEQSGRLPETLIKIGEIFESKTENTTKNLAVILEPVLLVLVWLGVVSVALAVILPIYSLLGGLNKGRNLPPPPVKIEEKAETEPALIEEKKEDNLQDKEGEDMAVATKPESKRLEILETETGYLNVRDNASKTGKIIAKVKPGETYAYENEQNGWYEITIQEESSDSGEEKKIRGWVLGDYVKIEE